MNLVWTQSAERDLQAILDYIAEHNSRASLDMLERMRRVAEGLSRLPHKGRPGTVAGTREVIPHPSYRMVYVIENDVIFVTAIVHTARQWPPEGGL